MLSGRLVRLIESNWDAITTAALNQIRSEPRMTHISALPDAELHEWAEHIQQHLSDWLLEGKTRELASHYEALGETRYEEAVPLAETVRALATLKATIFDFVRQRDMGPSTTEVYAEMELHIRLGRYFDFLVCHLVAGYERAMRRAAELNIALEGPASR
jgi:hypothetical protein